MFNLTTASEIPKISGDCRKIKLQIFSILRYYSSICATHSCLPVSRHPILTSDVPTDIVLIYPRMTPDAMETKFGTKSAITQLIQEISARSLRIIAGFRGWVGLLNDAR